MISRDDLSEAIYDIQTEYLQTKKFARKLIATFDDVDYEIVRRYIPKLSTWIRDKTGKQAELVQVQTSVLVTHGGSERWTRMNEIYIVWTGILD